MLRRAWAGENMLSPERNPTCIRLHSSLPSFSCHHPHVLDLEIKQGSLFFQSLSDWQSDYPHNEKFKSSGWIMIDDHYSHSHHHDHQYHPDHQNRPSQSQSSRQPPQDQRQALRLFCSIGWLIRYRWSCQISQEPSDHESFLLNKRIWTAYLSLYEQKHWKKI